MGWWQAGSIENPGLGSKVETETELVIGDTVADEMGAAIGAINKIYNEYWERDVCLDELKALLTFCAAGDFK
jgi:hypothetical protein